MSEKNEIFLGTLKGLALIFAYIMIDPLVKEINDTFGSTFLYHPLAVWLTLFSLTYVNTESLKASFTVVFVYEFVKMFWKALNPEAPEIVKIRKLMSRLQNHETLSDADLKYIDAVTPDNVVLVKNGVNI